jgi:hypothetical protein
MYALESAVLSAWYCSRPEIRRLLAMRDEDGLRILLQIEPAPDSNEMHPAWVANRREWANELQWHTCTAVQLETFSEAGQAGPDSRDEVVADLSWRDPSSNA